MTLRLATDGGAKLRQMSKDTVWLASLLGSEAVPASKFTGNVSESVWLPSEAAARAWMQYTKDAGVIDTTPPPAPMHVVVKNNIVTWTAEADLESGLAGFIIRRDGQEIARIPENNKSPYGRPIFQKNSYSDTPSQPLAQMQFSDSAAPAGEHKYEVIAINTAGIESR